MESLAEKLGGNGGGRDGAAGFSNECDLVKLNLLSLQIGKIKRGDEQ